MTHRFVSSDPTGFDPNCATCDGKARDSVHPRYQIATWIEDCAVWDRETGALHCEGQGFGVCDRLCDSLNGLGTACGEIGEVADMIRNGESRDFPGA